MSASSSATTAAARPSRCRLAATVQAARSQARQRLIGAAVLLGVGIVGFPLLFETQPRPIPVDMPIEIPRKDDVRTAGLPAVRPRRAAAPCAGEPVPPAAECRCRHAPASRRDRRRPAACRRGRRRPSRRCRQPRRRRRRSRRRTPAASRPRAKAAAQATAQAARRQGRSPRAGGAKPPSRRALRRAGGAFADARQAARARQKVEKLGLKTYTQVVETAAGKRTRVRVGPFATATRPTGPPRSIKAAGLPAAVLRPVMRCAALGWVDLGTARRRAAVGGASGMWRGLVFEVMSLARLGGGLRRCAGAGAEVAPAADGRPGSALNHGPPSR